MWFPLFHYTLLKQSFERNLTRETLKRSYDCSELTVLKGLRIPVPEVTGVLWGPWSSGDLGGLSDFRSSGDPGGSGSHFSIMPFYETFL